MRKLIKNIARVLQGRDDLGDRLDFSSSENTDARRAGGRFTRGNVAIQDNRYVTPEDLERERKRIAQHAI